LAPSTTIDGVINAVRRIILRASPETESALDVPSPQSEAFEWLLIWIGLGPIDASDEHIIQRFVLATLYYSTRGDEWKANTDWLRTRVDECEWLGLVCEDDAPFGQDFRHVTGIFLDDLGLQGSIPQEIILLTDLQTLQFMNNTVSGTIPDNIGLLSQLEFFLADDNELGGTLPTAIGLLSLLQRFAVNDNLLGGTIPNIFDRLTSLERLELSGNSFDGTLPSSWRSLSQLSILTFANNRLSGSLSTFEAQILSQLVVLSGSSNNLIGTIPTELGELRLLEDLLLGGNLFGGEIPTELGNLGNLVKLYVNGNGLTSSLPTELGRLLDAGKMLCGCWTAHVDLAHLV